MGLILRLQAMTGGNRPRNHGAQAARLRKSVAEMGRRAREG
jgi:hypothetical protein